MIKEKQIEVVGHSRNLVHYLSLGYDAVVRKTFMVDPTHLMPGATTKVTSVCDNCGRETSNAFKDYYISTASLTTPFYCKGCNQIKNKQTSMERWGVDNPMKSKEIQEKVRSTIVERYGVDHFSKTEEYKEKYRLTCLDRYGVENSFQSEVVKSKSKETSRIKWGKDYYLQTPEMRADSKLKKESKTIEKFRQIIGADYKIRSYVDAFFTVEHQRCGSNFEIPHLLLSKRLTGGVVPCLICNPVDQLISGIEIDVKAFLDDCGVRYVQKDRTVLGGK